MAKTKAKPKAKEPARNPVAELRELLRAEDASGIRALVWSALPKLPVDDLVMHAAYAESVAVRDVLLEAALARPEDCGTIKFKRVHVAALTGDVAWLEGATDEDVRSYADARGVGRPLETAVWKGHLAVVEALLARGAPIEGHELDLAASSDRLDLVTLLMAHGARPRFRTLNKITTKTSDELLDCLIAAGLDLNESESPIASSLGGECTEPAARIAHARRLIARGFRFGSAELLAALGDLRDGDLENPSVANALIDLACEPPGDEHVRLALDKCPVAVLDRLVAAGAPVRAGLRVKSTAPEAAAKRSWLAGQTPTTAAPIEWSEFARLDGADLTPELVCERLVGDRVFPGLEVGGDPEQPPSFSLGETEITDEENPTTHELTLGEEYIEYRLQTWATSYDEETRKVRAKVIFDALATAIAKLHGKVKGKFKRWELADRTITLDMSSVGGEYRAYTTVTLRLGPPG